MRPYAFTGQPLSQHIKGVAKRTENMIKSGYCETAYRKLKYAGLDLDRETLYDAILASAVFHDVGKAVEYYQRQFFDDGRCRNDRNLSFYLHEILSAVYFDRFLSKNSRWSNGLKILATLAVLNHMHSLRDYGKKLNIFNPLDYKQHRDLRILDGATISQSDLDNLVETMVAYDLDEEDLRQFLTRKISMNDVIGMGNKIQNFESQNKIVRLYNLILLPVVVGDVLDAVKNRRNDEISANRRAFILELSHCLGEDGFE